jgi:ubiquitin fusion degradation protein 1
MAGRSNMDEGDKILLPPSALEMLARMNVEYPMLFELRNDAIEKKTHCGVMEFSAEEGRCYMPFWMMQNMLVSHRLRWIFLFHTTNLTTSPSTFLLPLPMSSLVSPHLASEFACAL